MLSPDLIASLSAIAALISAYLASRSYALAREALRISKLERKAKEGCVEVYLSEIFSYKEVNIGHYVIASLLYTNKSEIPDSIARIELILHYTTENIKTNAVISATNTVPDAEVFRGVDYITPPVTLPARGVASIWTCFSLPPLLAMERNIELYEIEARLATGLSISVTSYIAGNISDAKNRQDE